MSPDSSSTEFYQWHDYRLSPEELDLIDQADRELCSQERFIKRIAFTKAAINAQNQKCREILARFPIQDVVFEDGSEGQAYLKPHELDFRSHNEPGWIKDNLDRLAKERPIYRHIVYFEDNPIYFEYFDATDERDRMIACLKHYQGKLDKQIAWDAKKKRKPTDSKRVMT